MAGAAHGKPVTNALNSSLRYEKCHTSDTPENSSFRVFSALQFLRTLWNMLSVR